MYSGRLVAAIAGAGWHDVLGVIGFENFLDQEVSPGFVFVGGIDFPNCFLDAPVFELFFYFFRPDATVPVAEGNPFPREPVVDFVDGIVLYIECMVGRFFFWAVDDVHGILPAVDGEVAALVRESPVVSREFAHPGGIDRPVRDIDSLDLIVKAGMADIQFVEMISGPVVLDGKD